MTTLATVVSVHVVLWRKSKSVVPGDGSDISAPDVRYSRPQLDSVGCKLFNKSLSVQGSNNRGIDMQRH